LSAPKGGDIDGSEAADDEGTEDNDEDKNNHAKEKIEDPNASQNEDEIRGVRVNTVFSPHRDEASMSGMRMVGESGVAMAEDGEWERGVEERKVW
jgi:hypothetical protein